MESIQVQQKAKICLGSNMINKMFHKEEILNKFRIIYRIDETKLPEFDNFADEFYWWNHIWGEFIKRTNIRGAIQIQTEDIMRFFGRIKDE